MKLIYHLLAISLFCVLTANSQTVQTPLGASIDSGTIETYFKEKIKENGTPGLSLVIINDGQIALHSVLGESAPNQRVTSKTIYEGASLSKPLFAYFTMCLVEKGLIDLDKPLHKYYEYPDIAYDNRYKKMTARMVLSHRSGFPNWRTDTPGDSLFLDFEPGERFQYSGEGYQYLALVLQEILNTDAAGLQGLFHNEVAKPLGLKKTRFIQNKKNLKNKARAFKNDVWLDKRDFGSEEFGSAYGVHSEAKDFAKWIIALMNKEGLSETSYAELFKNQTALPADNPNRSTGVTDLTLGFYTGDLPFGKIYGHGGNNNRMFTSLFFFNPDTKWGAVLFTNSGYGEEMGVEFLQFLMTYQDH